MTDKTDDVFAGDDPFENLEERLSDALDNGAQAELDTSEGPEATNDAELRLVMERIKTRSASRRPAGTVPTPTDQATIPASESEPVTNGDFDGTDTAPTEASSTKETATEATSSDIDSGGVDIVRGRPARVTNERDFRTPLRVSDNPDHPRATDDPRDAGGGADDAHLVGGAVDAHLVDGVVDAVVPEWSLPIEAAEYDAVQAADNAIDLSDLPDFLFDDDDQGDDRDESPPRSDPVEAPIPRAPVFDQPRSSTFGSLVIDSDSTNTDRTNGRGAGAGRREPASRPAFVDDAPSPQARDHRRVEAARSDVFVSPPSEPPRPSQLPPSGVAASQPPPGATAVQPALAVGLTPGTQSRLGPGPTQPPRSEPQGPMTTTLVIPREPVQERKRNSRGLLFTAGGITLIVLSVLVYANYFLGDGDKAPTKNMDPALEETTPTTQDNATTTSQTAPTPEVELTACDSEAAYVTITTQSESPIVAMIRFQFLKDGQIYYEEDSESPAIAAGEPLTMSLLLIGKELPPEYTGVEPDDCEAQVIGVAAA